MLSTFIKEKVLADDAASPEMKSKIRTLWGSKFDIKRVAKLFEAAGGDPAHILIKKFYTTLSFRGSVDTGSKPATLGYTNGMAICARGGWVFSRSRLFSSYTPAESERACFLR